MQRTNPIGVADHARKPFDVTLPSILARRRCAPPHVPAPYAASRKVALTGFRIRSCINKRI
jgi:hypothetical protein